MVTTIRRDKAKKFIKRRLRQLWRMEQEWFLKALNKPNKLNKSKAFGCNKSKCKTCHPTKYG